MNAIVTVRMFGKTVQCKAHIYGKPQNIYEGDHLYWIEREEDSYGLNQFLKDHKDVAVVRREDFISGKVIAGNMGSVSRKPERPLKPEDIIEDNEVVVYLKDGCTVRSSDDEHISGGYVRLCDSGGKELYNWHYTEWEAEPKLVMGAIINAMAGLRLEKHNG